MTSERLPIFLRAHTVKVQKQPKTCSHGEKPIRSAEKIGRNEPCPCGSGRKYKRCCLGKVTDLALITGTPPQAMPPRWPDHALLFDTETRISIRKTYFRTSLPY